LPLVPQDENCQKGGVEKFQLLSDKMGALFQAQSGLASQDENCQKNSNA
jgi:hypothetical protein